MIAEWSSAIWGMSRGEHYHEGKVHCKMHWEVSWSAFYIESKRHLISQVFVTHGRLGINSCTTSIILHT
jgi:hypothetical protein